MSCLGQTFHHNNTDTSIQKPLASMEILLESVNCFRQSERGKSSVRKSGQTELWEPALSSLILLQACYLDPNKLLMAVPPGVSESHAVHTLFSLVSKSIKLQASLASSCLCLTLTTPVSLALLERAHLNLFLQMFWSSCVRVR